MQGMHRPFTIVVCLLVVIPLELSRTARADGCGVSNPRAAHVLYIDFDGFADSAWQLNPEWHANPTISAAVPTFVGDACLCELLRTHVAEDYAPFDVNVTSARPTGCQLAVGSGVRIVVGGQLGQHSMGGIGSPAARASSFEQMGIVSKRDSRGIHISRSRIASTVTHEAAHVFSSWTNTNLVHFDSRVMSGLEYLDITSRGLDHIMGSIVDDDLRNMWWVSLTEGPTHS